MAQTDFRQVLSHDEVLAINTLRQMRHLGAADKRLVVALPTAQKVHVLTAALKMADMLDALRHDGATAQEQKPQAPQKPARAEKSAE